MVDNTGCPVAGSLWYECAIEGIVLWEKNYKKEDAEKALKQARWLVEKVLTVF